MSELSESEREELERFRAEQTRRRIADFKRITAAGLAMVVFSCIVAAVEFKEPKVVVLCLMAAMSGALAVFGYAEFCRLKERPTEDVALELPRRASA